MKFEVLTTVTVTITVLRGVMLWQKYTDFLGKLAASSGWKCGSKFVSNVGILCHTAGCHILNDTKTWLSGFTSETPPRGVRNEIVYFLGPVSSWAASDYWLKWRQCQVQFTQSRGNIELQECFHVKTVLMEVTRGAGPLTYVNVLKRITHSPGIWERLENFISKWNNAFY